MQRLGKTCLLWINVSKVCNELFGNTFESLNFLKSQGTSTDSLLARIKFIVDNNEQLIFNIVILSQFESDNVLTVSFWRSGND